MQFFDCKIDGAVDSMRTASYKNMKLRANQSKCTHLRKRL